jgi:methionyl-tRNA formyltransferase
MLNLRGMIMVMRVIFMGSGQLACSALAALLDHPAASVVAVVTQPDRPSGRRLRLTPCPVKAFVAGRGLEVFSPESVSAPDVVERLSALSPDLMAVVDFGQFIKKNALALPLAGAINVHPSLLPKYRGAAPIQWAIANGDTETGVTALYVTEMMDAGDIILQEAVSIHNEDTAVTLEPKLAAVGARLLLQALELIREGRVIRKPQDASRVTFARKLTKEDGRIDWPQPAIAIHNRVRGFVPWPCCACEAPDGSGRLLRVLKTRVESRNGAPGTVLELHGDGPLVACGEAALRVLEVQPEGKKPMPGAAYLCGHPFRVGEVLG